MILSPPQRQGLYDPAYEHDACGVAFVADLHGRRSHDVVAKGLSALCRLDHRGARGAEPNTGDGAGIMIQIPDAFSARSSTSTLPPAGAVRHRPGVPAHRRRSRPGAGAGRAGEVRPGRGRRGARLAGRAGRPGRPRRDRADAACPRIRQVFLAAHRLTDAAAGRRAAERHRPGPGRVLRAQAGRAGDAASAASPAYFPSLSAAHHRYKGMLTPDQLAGVLPGPDRRAGRQRDRAGALPVLHQHVPVLAAGPPVPVHRPQRRDQHHPRQPELDAAREALLRRPT